MTMTLQKANVQVAMSSMKKSVCFTKIVPTVAKTPSLGGSAPSAGICMALVCVMCMATIFVNKICF